MMSRFLRWVRRRGPLCATLTLALSSAACATAGHTSLATLIGPAERASLQDKASDVTVSEDGAVNQSAPVSRAPLNRVLAASGNVYLPVQLVRVSGGSVLAAANANLGVTSPVLGAAASIDASANRGVEIAAKTPVANAAVQLNPAGLVRPASPTVSVAIGGGTVAAVTTPLGGASLNTPLGAPVTAGLSVSSSGAGASITTPVAGANLASSPSTPVSVGLSTPLAGANVAVSAPGAAAAPLVGASLNTPLSSPAAASVSVAPASAGASVTTPGAGANLASSRSTPVAVGVSTPLGGANVAVSAPAASAAVASVTSAVLKPAGAAVNPLAGAIVVPVVKGAGATTTGILGSVGVKLPGGG